MTLSKLIIKNITIVIKNPIDIPISPFKYDRTGVIIRKIEETINKIYLYVVGFLAAYMALFIPEARDIINDDTEIIGIMYLALT